MGTTYDYVYEYELPNNNRNQRSTTVQQTKPQQIVPSHSTFPRAANMDPLVNLQHDKIWHKLYDPLDDEKVSHDAEIKKMARRQDRKVIKLEASYGSDRQTFIIKRNYDLRVIDVQEDAAKVFKMPTDQLVLYWKGRNICDTPNELLETLGIENNHQMRVCREDDPIQQNRRRELRAQMANDSYQQQQQQQQQSGYYPQPGYPTGQDQQNQGFGANQRGNYYQQLTNPSGPMATSFVVSLQVGFGDRLEGLIIGRPHPATVYDLQMEIQQRFGIPIHEQNVSYNGIPLIQYPPDVTLESIGIVNNSFVSLWYRNSGPQNYQQPPPPQQQQGPPMNDYYSNRQQPPTHPMYSDGPQSGRGNDGSFDMTPRRMDNMYNSNNNMNDQMQNTNQEVVKIEVFHGSDRHVLILRSAQNLRVLDLMEELQRITTVPIPQQKLYFRGQELQQMKDRSLRDVGIDNNAQVRLIGDPTKPRYEAMITGNR